MAYNCLRRLIFEAAEFIKRHVTKPVVALSPDSLRLPAGGWAMPARISGDSDTGQAKIAAFRENGIHVCVNLGEIGRVGKEAFSL